MHHEAAKTLIESALGNTFNEVAFSNLVRNLVKKYDQSKAFNYNKTYIVEKYRPFIKQYKRLGTYTDPNGQKIDILIISLVSDSSLDHARTRQRNFVADYLKGRDQKDAALVAYITDNQEDWRFSFVKVDYEAIIAETGKVKIKEDLTPARRFSFLVGKNEPNHTAQSQLLPLLKDDNRLPTIQEIEAAFNIESVTDEFFKRYKELYLGLREGLDSVLAKEKPVKAAFQAANIETSTFAKKLLGQIVFLFFLQKKGWLGVKPEAQWGSGSKNFLTELFQKRWVTYNNFFNEVLEPLFYEALAVQRHNNFFEKLNCKVPFLNGGLFEPISGYDWQKMRLPLPNSLFKDILDTFNLYNFTVREDEPLEKEVAVDPEMLGKVFENMLEITDRRSKGAFYTPREIVHYICQESLIYYLDEKINAPTKVKTSSTKPVLMDDLRTFIQLGDIAIENDEAIAAGRVHNKKFILPESIWQNASELDRALSEVKICDPAVGSGAFPVGMMTEIVRARMALSPHVDASNRDAYSLKWNCIENCLYGVDIDTSAIDIAKLRLWLSLVVDEENYEQIRPLPNLDYRIVCGNSLTCTNDTQTTAKDIGAFEQLAHLQQAYFIEVDPAEKKILRDKISKVLPRTFSFWIHFFDVFQKNKGFDIVVGNPPYVSTRGVSADDKKTFERIYGFSDDLYNHFYFRAFHLLRPNGVMGYISSKTFFTIQTKLKLRELLQGKLIKEIYDTAMPFSAMVDTCVVIAANQAQYENYTLYFKDGRQKLLDPEIYELQIDLYRKANNKVIFRPDKKNLAIYQKYNDVLKKLMLTWWPRIETSKKIKKNQNFIDSYTRKLQPGDVTLLGLLTEGGQGLATANNGRFVGVLAGTKEAGNIQKSRPVKLYAAVNTLAIAELSHIQSTKDAERYLSNLAEAEIQQLFERLKDKFGRDIFGQGYLFKIISAEQVADPNRMSEDEKKNGIAPQKPHWVPYDKGDKDGNRWYLETPYLLDWSKPSVKWLYEKSGKKGEGMPVVRNPDFYFRNGFCWSDIHTVLVKSRLKNNGVYDVKSMSMFSTYEYLPDWFFVFLLNSTFISEYDFTFINNTQTLQMNDTRQLPVVIPTNGQLQRYKDIFDRAMAIKMMQFSAKISIQKAEKQLDQIQQEVDREVLALYGLDHLE